MHSAEALSSEGSVIVDISEVENTARARRLRSPSPTTSEVKSKKTRSNSPLACGPAGITDRLLSHLVCVLLHMTSYAKVQFTEMYSRSSRTCTSSQYQAIFFSDVVWVQG